jgi:hypothetical protein
VKGGDRLQLLRTKHLLGQVGTGCVRDGVVRMDEIQSILFAHVHQFGGQAEGVGRVFEERIRGHLDFMNKNVLMKGSESKGRGVTDDVNLMA